MFGSLFYWTEIFITITTVTEANVITLYAIRELEVLLCSLCIYLTFDCNEPHCKLACNCCAEEVKKIVLYWISKESTHVDIQQ